MKYLIFLLIKEKSQFRHDKIYQFRFWFRSWFYIALDFVNAITKSKVFDSVQNQQGFLPFMQNDDWKVMIE